MSEHRSDRNPLELDPDAMRRLGYQAIDLLVDAVQRSAHGAVVPAGRDDRALADSLLEFSEAGEDPGALLANAVPEIFRNAMRLTHPRFFAYIPGPANYLSALGDLLAAGHNVFAGTTPHNQGPHEIEFATVRWLCDLAGMGPEAGGLFVSGGSVATLTALAAARKVLLHDRVDGARIYQSEHTHSSVDRALHILGFGRDQTTEIGADRDCRIDVAALESRIQEDQGRGLRPFCIVANAGTTSSGAVDDLASLADLCKRYDLWLHVDAAYGGGALLSSERSRFDGIEQADSISIDPHKWLFQPYESAVVLVRDPDWLSSTFGRMPAYMQDTAPSATQRNYRDMSPQVTRAFKALKLWLSLKSFGIDAFRRAVEAGLETARMAQRKLEADAQWEVVTPATLGVVTFRWVGAHLDIDDHDRLVPQVVDRVNREGSAFLSSTELFGHRVHRLCPIHPGVTESDIDDTLAAIARHSRELAPPPGRPPGS